MVAQEDGEYVSLEEHGSRQDASLVAAGLHASGDATVNEDDADDQDNLHAAANSLEKSSLPRKSLVDVTEEGGQRREKGDSSPARSNSTGARVSRAADSPRNILRGCNPVSPVSSLNGPKRLGSGPLGPELPEKETLASFKANVSSPIAHERRVLDISPEEAFRINSVKMKSKGQRCLHTEEPENFEDANMEECWRRAMDEELGLIRDNDTWELADLPNGHNAIELQWVYIVKKDAEGYLVKHKAMLVAKPNVQEQDVDFEEVFAPVDKMNSVKLLIALAAQES